MEAEDVINLAASSISGSDDENEDIKGPDCGPPCEADSRINSSDNLEDDSKSESMEISGCGVENEDGHSVEQKEQDKDIVSDSSLKVELTGTVDMAETVIASARMNSSNSSVHVQNGFPNVQDRSPACNQVFDVSSTSGVKRARVTFDEQSPSVHIIYNSISRASRQKLEELLQQWSEWHAQHGSSLSDPNEVIESGEETYFPAIRVGLEKGSSVSFWIDNQTRNQQDKGSLSFDSNAVPLYDRGYALGLTSGDGLSNLEGGLEIPDDASRCFNCGSYSHSLKECPKPRDNVAVNTARKLHKSKRNLNSASRNPTRYYQSSVGGKYDGLRPGALGAETRQLLGLGELDPPPWLNRMRELGYPPGYLDADIEDQPSGITIYADGEVKVEQEDGEIVETDPPEPQKKMSVEFPGINAPIPENADERLWAAGPSNSDPHRDRTHHRSNHYSEPISRGHHREQRWSRDYRDDGPPGCDPVISPSTSSYPPRYAVSYNPHSSSPAFGRSESAFDSPAFGRSESAFDSPAFGRSESDRYRRSPLVYEDYGTHGSYSSSYLNRDYVTSRFEHEVDKYRDDYSLDHSSRSMDEYDRHRHRSSRW